MPIMVTGAAGQDGGYLCEQLLEAGQEVVGVIHPKESLPAHFPAIADNSLCGVEICDMGDPASIRKMLRDVKPSKIFHFAAISHPGMCADNPSLSRAVNVTSAEVVLDWIKRDGKETRVLLLSSAAIFGNPAESPQTEETSEQPLGEYGEQKLAIRKLAEKGRADGLFCACAIPYNHESPRRSEDFVIAKIVNSVARIRLGLQEKLDLGDLSPRRDWGYAPEYVQAFAWMLDVAEPLDLIIASGETHSVGEAAALALESVDLDVSSYLTSDPTQRRNDDPQDSVGNPALAWQELGWKARTKFKEMVPKLVQFAFSKLQKDGSDI